MATITQSLNLNEQGKSLLIVEDDKEIRDTLRFVLEQEGFEVSVAGNGVEALALLPHITKPSLILLDIMMPQMNGTEFADILDKDPLYSSIPVVVLTAAK